VATLPTGEDPDSIVHKGGAAALAEHTDVAIDVLDRKIQILQKRGFLDTTEGKRRAVDGLLLTVRAASDEALRDIYLDRVSAVTGVRRATLEREMERSATDWRRRRVPQQKAPLPAAEGVPKLGAERKLLLLLIRDRGLVQRVAEQVEADNFRTPEYREIYRALLAADSASPVDEPGQPGESLDWADHLPGPLYERVREIVADPEELTHPEAVLVDAIARLRARELEKRLTDLMTEVLVADTEAAVELASEIKKVRQELAAHGVRMTGRGFFKSD